MNNWKVIFATMVIFGTGVITGGLLVRHVEQSRQRRPQRVSTTVRPAQPQPSSAGVMRIEFLRHVEKELGLTPEQRDPIDKIIKDGQERTKKLMDTVEPGRREEFKRTMEEFRAILTPEQQKRLDTIIKQQQQRAREQRKAAPSPARSPQSPPTNSSAGATNP